MYRGSASRLASDLARKLEPHTADTLCLCVHQTPNFLYCHTKYCFMSKLLAALAVIFAVTNWKVLPFTWTIRFLTQIVKNLIVRRHIIAKSIFEQRTFGMYVPPMEIDMNVHKTNSTYFSDLDIARCDLLTHILKQFYKDFNRENGHFPYTALGNVAASFRKELKVFQRYRIVSRVAAFDEKWVYIFSTFVSGKDTVHARAVSSYVFKSGRSTIPPRNVFGKYFSEAEIQKALELGTRYKRYIKMDEHDLEKEMSRSE